MADTFQLEIVTPDRALVNEQAEEVQIPGRNGYLGILPGHAPLITELAVGEISYRSGGNVQRLAVAWGFAEVLGDKVTILAETAERAADIDVARARQALVKAAEAMKAGQTEEEFSEASEKMEVAQTRLKVAGADTADMANLVP